MCLSKHIFVFDAVSRNGEIGLTQLQGEFHIGHKKRVAIACATATLKTSTQLLYCYTVTNALLTVLTISAATL